MISPFFENPLTLFFTGLGQLILFFIYFATVKEAISAAYEKAFTGNVEEVSPLIGGAALRDFSITILIGLLIGTYSSVFIASPIVLWISGRKGGDLRKAVTATPAPYPAMAIPREAVPAE